MLHVQTWVDDGDFETSLQVAIGRGKTRFPWEHEGNAWTTKKQYQNGADQRLPGSEVQLKYLIQSTNVLNFKAKRACQTSASTIGDQSAS